MSSQLATTSEEDRPRGATRSGQQFRRTTATLLPPRMRGRIPTTTAPLTTPPSSTPDAEDLLPLSLIAARTRATVPLGPVLVSESAAVVGSTAIAISSAVVPASHPVSPFASPRNLFVAARNLFGATSSPVAPTVERLGNLRERFEAVVLQEGSHPSTPDQTPVAPISEPAIHNHISNAVNEVDRTLQLQEVNATHLHAPA